METQKKIVASFNQMRQYLDNFTKRFGNPPPPGSVQGPMMMQPIIGQPVMSPQGPVYSSQPVLLGQGAGTAQPMMMMPYPSPIVGTPGYPQADAAGLAAYPVAPVGQPVTAGVGSVGPSQPAGVQPIGGYPQAPPSQQPQPSPSSYRTLL